jgi:hypothetical protein
MGILLAGFHVYIAYVGFSRPPNCKKGGVKLEGYV